MLVITGVSAVIRPAIVGRRVTARDGIFYVLSIGLLLQVFRDGHATISEALLFLGLYVAYLVVLYLWPRFMPEPLPEEEVVTDVLEQEIGIEETKTGVYYQVTQFISRGLGLLTGDPHKSYGRAFIVAIIIIVGISYLLVESSVLLAGAIGVPSILVALTILAAGSSAPDMIASALVAREGRGDMAISNAIGSNIFDITIGLGLPWLIVLLLRPGVVEIGNTGLWESALILLGTVVILLIFMTTGRLLSRIEGAILIGLYIAYVVWIWFSNLT
ncbi:MAG: hypothetical protein R3C44_09355 [Chloroflexota bacterium]